MMFGAVVLITAEVPQLLDRSIETVVDHVKGLDADHIPAEPLEYAVFKGVGQPELINGLAAELLLNGPDMGAVCGCVAVSTL